jgi:DNA polymerase sigma
MLHFKAEPYIAKCNLFTSFADATPPGGRVLIPVSASSDGVNHAKRLLQRRRHVFTSVFAIPKAKTPIVKFMHIPTGTNCDLTLKNALGVNNSALIRLYLSMDPRLEPFLLILKYWAKKNDLSGHGKISNYALVMIALFYLQQLEDPVIPVVTTLQEGVNKKVIIAGWECSINTSFSSNTCNTMSVPELLCGFFKFYSQFDCGMKVICPLTGTSVPKLMFQTPEELPEVMHRYKEYVSGSGPDIHRLKVECDMCVQDPFELTHNLTAGMSSKALDNFKKHCIAAAEVCDEELSTNSEATGFLKRLFFESIKLLDKSPHITIPLGKYLTSVLPESDSTQKEVSANIEDELRKGWYKTVLKFLIEIFEDVMKFKVDCGEPEPSRKIQKLERCSDVSDEMQVLHCSGYYRVWEGRKAAAKEVSIPENVVAIARERIISDFMVAKYNEQSSTCNPVTTFECLFHPQQQPTRVIIKLCDKKSDKGCFKALVGFLHGRLPVWIEKCLMSQHYEQVVKKEV